MRSATQVRYIEGNWEITEEDGYKRYFAGPYAETNVLIHYNNAARAMATARRNPVTFDCAELAPHFRRAIQFRDGSWHRLMDDDTWAAKSSLGAIRGCLIYRCLHLRPCHLKLMFAYLKEHAT